ncbi:nucleotide-binding protein [Xanthomonas campestris pv. raphani]|uniref:nucleotide-binding protein n=1 Tax=Xanthomonas campestris TaxID=339 RepID=UPI002B22BD12|nr:nucleotide-binding protein [Xanthomonas campestris]MEA9746511.1 nucleotide-binding protein [Xanthomonas campestris pv. raphani]MEA9846693.1 nucleotide-binding protein [Xanthomonas campestris pv. raphani]MEA9927586.1 nucleotide-binding protein [Xanthomonas campestris pv. raphani]
MSTAALKTRYEQAEYLLNMLTSHSTGGQASNADYSLLRTELVGDASLSEYLPSFVRTNRDLSSFWSFIKGKFSTYQERRDFLNKAFTPLLDVLEFGPGAVHAKASGYPTAETSGVATSAKLVVARNKRNVFIVHGRDEAAKQEVARFVESLGLKSIILHEQASSGMTIIEKIEHYANDADFALVLYTACDQGRGNHEKALAPRDRARQNVVFEHGYLIGKLGRENVCALRKGDIETPNDISGVVYVSLDTFGGWKAEVSKELKACGYTLSS